VSFLPIAVSIAVAANLSDRLIAQFGTKFPVTAGFVISAVGMFLLSHMGMDSHYGLSIAPGMILSGFGIGLVMAPAFSCATLGVPSSQDGVASASLNSASAADIASNAALSGFTSTFALTVWIFLAGALLSIFLLPHGPNKYLAGAGPVIRH
jgi:MFS family permease